MAGYWPRSFVACLWTETESRSVNSHKKGRGKYPAILTEKAWSIKDLVSGHYIEDITRGREDMNFIFE